jgi:hypothetical protein
MQSGVRRTYASQRIAHIVGNQQRAPLVHGNADGSAQRIITN